MDNDFAQQQPGQLEQLESLKETVMELKEVIEIQDNEIARLNSTPLVYATVVSEKHEIDPDAFQKGDSCLVIDPQDRFREKIGTIVSDGQKEGRVKLNFPGIPDEPEYNIGIVGGAVTQLQLLGKNDGTNILVSVDGKLVECRNSHNFYPKPGETAKLNMGTNQVMEIYERIGIGDMVAVAEVVDRPEEGKAGSIKVESGGETRLVINHEKEVESGDRVVLDSSNVIVIKHHPAVDDAVYNVPVESRIGWDDIGGVTEAIDELRTAIESPIDHPEVYNFYNMKTPNGFMFHGPPGCGKTLLGKATARALADKYGKRATNSGFNYVKAPEILSMWVGESERESRAIFQRMRKHYEMHGYPSVTFVDEADAIFGERGGDQTQRHHETLVAMWLAEMDGMDANPGILIFATNRPKSLDGAITREGRIDKSIKVSRPDAMSAPDIFKIHLRGVPLNKTDEVEVAGMMTSELLSSSRPLYRLNHPGGQEVFGLNNCISGSMIAALVTEAKGIAMKRDIASQNGKKKAKPKGVGMDDFSTALSRLYLRHMNINHSFDLQDFLDSNGINPKQCQSERIAPSKEVANALG